MFLGYGDANCSISLRVLPSSAGRKVSSSILNFLTSLLARAIVRVSGSFESSSGSSTYAGADRSTREWRVSIVGWQENDNWELKIEGLKGFERSFTLIG